MSEKCGCEKVYVCGMSADEHEIVRLETSLRESKEREDAARRQINDLILEISKANDYIKRALKAESDAASLRSTLDDMGFQEADCADCARNLKGARKVLLPKPEGKP